MVNSILTIVNNITTYVTNNSKVFICAFVLAAVATIVNHIRHLNFLDEDDIPIILLEFIFDFILASVILMCYVTGVGDTLAYACNVYREWFPFIFVISGITCLILSQNNKSKPVFKFIFFRSMAAYALSYALPLGYNILMLTDV